MNIEGIFGDYSLDTGEKKATMILDREILAVPTIEHLAKTLWPSKNWNETLMVMLTTCFDAAGKEHGEPCLAVAGFVSSAGDWTEFSGLWNDRLQKDGLTWFHKVDFAHSTGEFKYGWRENEPRRRSLLNDLMELITEYSYRKFGCAVINQSFGSLISEENKSQYYLNAYSLAGRTCAAHVRQWIQTEKIRGASVELVFAEGDEGKGKLITRLNEDGYVTPGFRYPRDTMTSLGPSSGFVPLQASDWLAYEVFKAAKNKPDSDWRWAAGEFNKKPGEPTIYRDQDLNALDESLDLAALEPEWWK